MPNVQIRVDENLRTRAQAVAQGMGLDLSTDVSDADGAGKRVALPAFRGPVFQRRQSGTSGKGRGRFEGKHALFRP